VKLWAGSSVRIEHQPPKLVVVGSNPTPPATNKPWRVVLLRARSTALKSKRKWKHSSRMNSSMSISVSDSAGPCFLIEGMEFQSHRSFSIIFSKSSTIPSQCFPPPDPLPKGIVKELTLRTKMLLHFGQNKLRQTPPNLARSLTRALCFLIG
jgi:hypothetical protein